MLNKRKGKRKLNTRWDYVFEGMNQCYWFESSNSKDYYTKVKVGKIIKSNVFYQITDTHIGSNGTSSEEYLWQNIFLRKFSKDSDKDTTIGELMSVPETKRYVTEHLLPMMEILSPEKKEHEEHTEVSVASEAITEEMQEAMIKYMPLRSLRSFGGLTNERMEQMVAELNSLVK